jgi:ribonuclease D
MSDQHSLPPPTWVDTAPGFRAMLDHLRAEPALAVDTESNSLYVYHERVCLIQISVPGADYLIDSLLLHDLPGLGPLFSDPKVLKVLHGADYDLSVLHRDYAFTFRNLHDTMWASRILGWPAHGLAALLRAHFGVTLNKKYQRANWGVRPLPPQQLDYARLDTHFLLPLREIQVQELDARGRWPQARHRFSKLASTQWEPKSFDSEGFWKLAGLRDLDDRGRGVLRELYLLRDQWARTGNRPPFRVLNNKAMLTLSAERPSDLRSLRAVKGVSSGLVRRYGSELLEAINRGKERPLAWEDRPHNNHHRHRIPNGRQSAASQARFEALRAWRNAKAGVRGVEPDIVLTNETLWAVALRNPGDNNDLTRDGLLASWQADEFGKDLLAVIRETRSTS